MKISFRAHTAHDVPARVKWLNHPQVTKYLGSSKSKPTTLEEEATWYKNYAKDETRSFYTILCDDQAIGLVGLTAIDHEKRMGRVFMMIGDPQYWRLGIGSKAIEYIIKKARELDLKALSLEVDKNNLPAISLYRRCGFIDKRQDDAEIIMWLSLNK